MAQNAWNTKPQYTDPKGNPYGETEMALLRLHGHLIEFYSKHNPRKVNEDHLTILMQFFIDAGGVALNKKLMKKYGEDLQTFKRMEAPPPVDDETMERIRRTSLRAQMKDMPMDLPPPPSKPEYDPRQSLESRLKEPVVFEHRPRKKEIRDPEYIKFQRAKAKEMEDLENDLFGDDFDEPKREPSEDQSLKLNLLDYPNVDPLEDRDLIEAFYSKHDPEKLNNEAAIDKFVAWVEENSMQELSMKLKNKYGEGLFDMEKLGRRRRNLEDMLTAFYTRFDRPKLDNRLTILMIIGWTFQNGIPELNKKFLTRYGFPVIDTTQELDL